MLYLVIEIKDLLIQEKEHAKYISNLNNRQSRLLQLEHKLTYLMFAIKKEEFAIMNYQNLIEP